MNLKAKSAAALMAAGTAAGLVIAASGTASASLLPQYQTVSNGTAGYYATAGKAFSSVQAIVTPQAAAVNIGGTGQGGIGVQLCDPNNGLGIQLGLVSNGSTFTVEYATGTLSGAAKDACVGNGVLANPKILHGNLTGVPAGDNVQLFEKFSDYQTAVWTGTGKHKHKVKIWQGRASFQAFDITSGFEVYSQTVSGLNADWHMTNAGAGVQQDTTGMSACTPVTPYSASAPEYTEGTTAFASVKYTGGSGACNDVADFSDVTADGRTLGVDGYGLANWNAIQGITTGNGLKANAAIVAPNDTLQPVSGAVSSSFSVYAGQVLG